MQMQRRNRFLCVDHARRNFVLNIVAQHSANVTRTVFFAVRLLCNLLKRCSVPIQRNAALGQRLRDFSEHHSRPSAA